jgi:long-chain acyl-CoA synthetase
MPLLSGATIVYSEGIKKLVDNLKEVRPTIMISVPRIFEKFHDVIWDKINSSSPLKKKISIWALKQKKNTFGYKIADILVFKKIRYALGGNFRFIVSGGASLNKNVAKFFAKIGVLVLEGYGLTETSPVIAVNLVNEYKFGTVGKIVPDVQVKISNEKEVLVKGPNVFNSYFENKEETQKVIDQEGWFHTGDLGFIDKEGFLTIIGRRKEMIVTSGGKNVWPEHLEGILNNDKFVSQSMIVGHNKKFVSALIVPDWQELEIFLKEKNIPLQDRKNLVENPTILSLFEERMTNNINSNLSEYEKIKKFSLLFEEFSQAQDELTPTLKLRRHIIERHYQEKIESMYE